MGRTLAFKGRPQISAASSIVGPKEGLGPLASCFDEIMQDDLLGLDSWEKAESEMIRRAAMMCIEQVNMSIEDVDVMLCGDLLNQIIASGFAARALGVPFLGLYGACSTMVEAIILGAALVDSGYRKNAMCAASSHFCSAERQYRFPLEMGTQRPPSAQWTATACGTLMLVPKAEKPLACVTHGTLGVVTDYEIKDANQMGAAMAPAVADTLQAHLRDLDRTPEDYDLIVTGDLGYIGRNILHELLKQREIHVRDEQLVDCGASLFYQEQDTHAGASGCGCVAAVTCGKFLKELRDGKHSRILVLGSGAMLSPISTQQGESIPCISYGVALEGVD
ncbi:stage V sporulation protein AD [Eubacteriales bacterium OttesenSCG-928-N13]|nr:stage V sporulation protein AD [Eubacteriales bacterium OttesenSCG-928-N13]